MAGILQDSIDMGKLQRLSAFRMSTRPPCNLQSADAPDILIHEYCTGVL